MDPVICRTGSQYSSILFCTDLLRLDIFFCLSLSSGGRYHCVLDLRVAGSILSVESNQNVESKTEKCEVQNNIWSVDSQENH